MDNSIYNSGKVFTKRHEDRLDYDVDYSRWLARAGDTIAQILNVSLSAGTTVALDGQEFSGTIAKVWLKDGTVGETVTVTVEIRSVQGREKEVCFKVRVRGSC